MPRRHEFLPVGSDAAREEAKAQAQIQIQKTNTNTNTKFKYKYRSNAAWEGAEIQEKQKYGRGRWQLLEYHHWAWALKLVPKSLLKVHKTSGIGNKVQQLWEKKKQRVSIFFWNMQSMGERDISPVGDDLLVKKVLRWEGRISLHYCMHNPIELTNQFGFKVNFENILNSFHKYMATCANRFWKLVKYILRRC